jgi:hypothetical protein
MRSDLEPRLRGLYRAPAPGQAAHRDGDEAQLVAAVARRGGVPRAGAAGSRPRRWPRWLRMPRLALAGVLGVAVAVGACVMPAQYPVSLGYGFEIVVEAERWAEVDPEALAMHLDERLDVERIELRVAHLNEERVSESGAPQLDQGVRIQLFVFGDAVDSAALLADLQQEFPALADAELRDVPLSGTVHGTFGGELSHRFLDLTIDGHGVEEAERRLLAELVARGFAPEDATVDISEREGADGQRRIEVRVRAER